MPERTAPPFRLGLTGNIAVGKSTVLAMLADLGAATIDADAVYHELIVPDAPLWRALVDRFGWAIIAPDNTIDRRALGALVFADPTALAALDRLTHPAVIDEIERRLPTIAADVVVIDAVKLVESGLHERCHAWWLVVCDVEQQIRRLMARNGLDRAEAERRIAAQPPLLDKPALADRVIDNSGSLAETRSQVERGWREVCDSLKQ
jgi:dephospho-CoA kinase